MEDDQLNKARGNPISSYHLDERHRVAESLIPQSAKRILDVGCGEAYFLKRLSKDKSRELYGIDVSKKNLDFAKKLVPHGNFSIADASKLKFKDSYFDCVLFLEVLDHLPNYVYSLKEAKRVLKKGGCVVMSFPDSSSVRWRTIWNIWTRTFGSQWHEKHVHEMNSVHIKSTLKKLGYKDIVERRAFFGLIIVIRAKK